MVEGLFENRSLPEEGSGETGENKPD